jgi:hypothetical protein
MSAIFIAGSLCGQTAGQLIWSVKLAYTPSTAAPRVAPSGTIYASPRPSTSTERIPRREGRRYHRRLPGQHTAIGEHGDDVHADAVDRQRAGEQQQQTQGR